MFMILCKKTISQTQLKIKKRKHLNHSTCCTLKTLKRQFTGEGRWMARKQDKMLNLYINRKMSTKMWYSFTLTALATLWKSEAFKWCRVCGKKFSSTLLAKPRWRATLQYLVKWKTYINPKFLNLKFHL